LKTKPPTRPPARAARSTAPAPAAEKGQVLRIPAEEGKTEARMFADLVTRGDALGAVTAMRFAEVELGKVDVSEMVASLRATGAAVNSGDLSEAERMLHAQAVCLNVIFCDMARRSHANFKASYLEAGERFMRLAFKAQSQCRATLETLAAVKNPPIVYARQMNYANGPQQVNNGVAEHNGRPQQPPARTQEPQNPPNQLLEDATHGSAQLDTRAKAEAGGSHPGMAPLGALDGAENCKGQGQERTQCVEGRRTARAS